MRTLFTLSALLFITALQAQVCDSRQVASFTSNANYTLNGTAVLEKNQDSSLVLRLNSDFSASSGPDLFVYLTVQNASPQANGNTHYEVAALAANSGAQAYNLPASVDFDAFTFVMIHCKRFNSPWGGGQMAASAGTCSAVTSTNTVENSVVFQAFPNPVKEELNINTAVGGTLSLYNALGQMVWQKNETQNFEQIDLSAFEAGLYLLEFQYEGERKTERIIKQ